MFWCPQVRASPVYLQKQLPVHLQPCNAACSYSVDRLCAYNECCPSMLVVMKCTLGGPTLLHPSRHRSKTTSHQLLAL